jgi:uncharacterized membrane protein
MATQHINQDPAQYILLTPAQHARTRKLDRIMHRFGDFIMEQWATIITVALGILVFLAISVPFLSYFGLDSLAKPIFFALHAICAQIPSHSFYIFGHQLGFCARNLSIYTSMFIGSLIFVLSKKRLPGIPWWLWLLLILPMAWDGLTQMFGLRESDWILRVITGSLFGFANIWFVFPMMHKTLQEPPAPQMQTRTYRPIPRTTQISNTQISGIERISMAIRSILPPRKQHENSIHHTHTAFTHTHTDRVYHSHASSIHNLPMDPIYRVHDSSNNVSNNSGNILEE